jgi:hypothetical protein
MNTTPSQRPKTRASQKPRATGRRQVEATDEKAPILLSATLPGGGPGEWNGEPFRATVLLYAPEEIAGYLRRFAEALFSPLVERGPFVPLEYRGSYVKAKLRAVMVDLRYTARFLAYVAREATDVMVDQWPRSEAKLGYFADQLALEVEKIADTIDARIEKGRGRRS